MSEFTTAAASPIISHNEVRERVYNAHNETMERLRNVYYPAAEPCKMPAAESPIISKVDIAKQDAYNAHNEAMERVLSVRLLAEKAKEDIKNASKEDQPALRKISKEANAKLKKAEVEFTIVVNGEVMDDYEYVISTKHMRLTYINDEVERLKTQIKNWKLEENEIKTDLNTINKVVRDTKKLLRQEEKAKIDNVNAIKKAERDRAKKERDEIAAAEKAKRDAAMAAEAWERNRLKEIKAAEAWERNRLKEIKSQEAAAEKVKRDAAKAKREAAKSAKEAKENAKLAMMFDISDEEELKELKAKKADNDKLIKAATNVAKDKERANRAEQAAIKKAKLEEKKLERDRVKAEKALLKTDSQNIKEEAKSRASENRTYVVEDKIAQIINAKKGQVSTKANLLEGLLLV